MLADLEKKSPCKVNLLLNILGPRPDGFHELETILQPVKLYDTLRFTRLGQTLELSCSDPSLPTDSRNLVHRAATAFLEAAGAREGVRIYLEKKIPQAAGLGGGSGNAATTLLGLNELFGLPLSAGQLHDLAARLGSDVPFFLQNQPALATGRGEHIEPLAPFPALAGAMFLLIHPGFGISTAWAYKQLVRFPAALNGQPGRARKLIDLLLGADLAAAGREFYNTLEAPALEKFPLLALFQEFLRAQGVPATLMSGSGSTTFTIVRTETEARKLESQIQAKFGPCWTAVVPV
ncbi:MAG TPA: 4-(cytidine 5'-diphospho)-2-C-methyl-D-erythritol kinase [Verrucomicrobiae bacterium]|nr:4-(cytidine 5'-diphospho)-2-C-methyl-D-erythritol kinase [Verrucomicrobiae bacterium]